MNTPVSSCCDDQIELSAISVAEAVERIIGATPAVSHFERLAVRDCLNRVLHEDIISPVDVPGSDNSAMDGIAVHHQYLPESGSKTLTIVGTAFAGKPYNDPIGENECIRIMTGAILPADADCVIMQEKITLLDDERVQIESGNRQHQNVRFAGEDIKKGQAVLKQGTVIKAAELGVIASLGIAECTVTRRPRVSFFSTGDELKSVGETLQRGDIYDSNRYTLYGLLSRCDVNIIDMGVIRDHPDAIREALLQAAAASDLIITSGGVSVGEADYIKLVLDEIGDMDFWKIAMKPGRPLTFGTINDTLFFGLPGNPVAVMVTFYQFVIPCLQKLAGKHRRPALSLRATSLSDIRKRSNRREFQRAVAYNNDQGELLVELTGKQGSGILTSMSRANCLIVLPEDSTSVSAGDTVSVEFFEDYF